MKKSNEIIRFAKEGKTLVEIDDLLGYKSASPKGIC